MSLSVTGLLIQAVPGILGALGLWGKRRGFAAQAAFSTAWRLSWIAAAVPIWTEYGEGYSGDRNVMRSLSCPAVWHHKKMARSRKD